MLIFKTDKFRRQEGESMLIEIFTNGSVLIDGQDSESYRAEEVLYDYLVNPAGFKVHNKKTSKKAA
ncbi:MAG: hypothetical protein A2W80_13870 [Candidatus Riflebacteria bacterium GWC2_50_8]|nr:MAG: hypothetical protein A2W80_13870 [Candidatus Riflebacteria bacterium GWC2_50_8]